MSSRVQRFGSVVGVKEKMLERYKELHADPWPDVLAILKRHHIQNYSIYCRQLADGRHYLFSYFEYTGADFEQDMKGVAAEAATQRWWAECVPCLDLLPDRGAGEIWAGMKEVFHLE